MKLCLFFRRDQRDCWLGLHRNSSLCTCSQATEAECEACRQSWSWNDGTDMSWYNWLPREPGGANCGRLGVNGWAEYECSAKYRFICERGITNCTHIQPMLCNLFFHVLL